MATFTEPELNELFQTLTDLFQSEPLSQQICTRLGLDHVQIQYNKEQDILSFSFRDTSQLHHHLTYPLARVSHILESSNGDITHFAMCLLVDCYKNIEESMYPEKTAQLKRVIQELGDALVTLQVEKKASWFTHVLGDADFRVEDGVIFIFTTASGESVDITFNLNELEQSMAEHGMELVAENLIQELF